MDSDRPIVPSVPIDPESVVGRGIEEGWIEAPRRDGLEPVRRALSSSAVFDALTDDRGR
jgi:hypothetical protein